MLNPNKWYTYLNLLLFSKKLWSIASINTGTMLLKPMISAKDNNMDNA